MTGNFLGFRIRGPCTVLENNKAKRILCSVNSANYAGHSDLRFRGVAAESETDRRFPSSLRLPSDPTPPPDRPCNFIYLCPTLFECHPYPILHNKRTGFKARHLYRLTSATPPPRRHVLWSTQQDLQPTTSTAAPHPTYHHCTCGKST